MERKSFKYTLRGGPEYITRAAGAYFWDVDGRQFTDYLMGYGPILLGHADQRVTSAVTEQMAAGTIYSLESPKVIQLAERLCQHIPCAERVTFLVGGSSATTAAVRCARAVTGRERIVRCGYHGWFDWCFPNDPGAPVSHADRTIAVPMNDLDALRDVFTQHKDQIACFILEAYLGDGPVPGYAAGVRELCDEFGIIFIVDEVKTGFRFDLGGAQNLLGYDADLATFGKAMCNGLPGSVLVGKAALLDRVGGTFIGATFHGDLASVAAANAVLDVLEQGDCLSPCSSSGSAINRWYGGGFCGSQLSVADARISSDAGGRPDRSEWNAAARTSSVGRKGDDRMVCGNDAPWFFCHRSRVVCL